MMLCKNTIQIVYEYIHRDLYNNVIEQLCTRTVDLEYASSSFVNYRYKIIKCIKCVSWTWLNINHYNINYYNSSCDKCRTCLRYNIN